VAMPHPGRGGCTGAYPDHLRGATCHLSPGLVRDGPVRCVAVRYRDAVIDYVKAQPGPISPAIEVRLVFK